MRSLPIQTVSLKEKLQDDMQWAKDTIDFLCTVADDQLDMVGNSYHRKLSNYELYNNILNQNDFERECNPLGLNVGQYKDEIHPYNKTYNKIQVLLGEELKRKTDYRAVIVNAEGIKSKEVKRTELLRDYIESKIEQLKQYYKQKASEKNPPPNQEQMEPDQAQMAMQEYENSLNDEVSKILNPKEIENFMATEYQEVREIMVQQIINYLMRELDIKDKKNDSFKHACIAGEGITWVGIRAGEPALDVVNPLKFFYHKSGEVKYIQDGEYAGYRTYMSTSDILNNYSKFLTEEEIDNLQQTANHGTHGIRTDLIGPKMKYHNVDIEFEYNRRLRGEEGSYGYSDANDWEVTHVEWVSRAKVGFIRFKDEDGEDQMDLVSEDFEIPEGSEKRIEEKPGGEKCTIWTLPEGEELEFYWVPEVWEGTRIGNHHDSMYINIRKKAVQFRNIDNPWKVKLGYHGYVYNATNAPSISLMDRMKPYQYLYFIVMHKLKRLIARDKGPAFPLDLSMVDEKIGLQKTLYYLEELDYDLYNSLMNAEQPGSAQRGKLTGRVERGNTNQILGYIDLLRQLDIEIGEAAGVTKQREGAIGAQEAVTNAQQNIQQSNHITEKLFYDHNKMWETVMNSLVQVTQYCWKGNKIVKQYVLDDLSRYVLDIDGEELHNADFGIYVSNNIDDAELIETLKQMALPILQNEGKLMDIVRIYKAMSASQLEREFKSEERERERKQQQQEEAQRQMQQEAIEAEKEAKERQYAHELQLKQMDLEIAIRKAEIDVFKFQKDLDVNNNNIPDPLEIEKLRTEKDYKTKELEFKTKQHQDEMRLAEKKIEVDKIKAKQKSSSKK